MTRKRMLRPVTLMGAALVAAACLSNDPLFAQKKAAPTPAKTAPTPAPAKTRTEKDLLGEKQVPAEAYYGVQTMRGMESFQLSGVAINHYPGYVEAWAIVKLAAARANIEVGAMTPERLAMIEKAAAAVLAGKYHDQFLVDWPRSPSSSRSGSPPLPKG